MTVEVIIEPAGLEREWWELWLTSPLATPFQSPAWLIPWQRHFGSSDDRILVARRNGRAVAILPLFHFEDRYLLWGAGTSDYLDGLFAPGVTIDDLRQAADALDLPLDVSQLSPVSPLALISDVIGSPAQPRRPGEPCLVLCLPPDRRRGIFERLAYYRRRAGRTGIGPSGPAGPEVFAHLVDLHERRWAMRGETGVLADPRVLAWHREALPQLAASGLLVMRVLRKDGKVVGAYYGLRAKRRDYYYIGGFDPQLQSLGLGTILIGDAIEAAEARGSIAFDFLRGREAYKYRWGAVEQATMACMIAPAAAYA